MPRAVKAKSVLPTMLTALLLSVGFVPAQERTESPDSPRACRSVHLWWSNQDRQQIEASAFYLELRVDRSTPGSYFMACGFSKGYFGIQELYDGRKIALFSVWEPGKQNNPNLTPEERRVIKMASGENVRVKRFGGEGTGGQSFYDLEWNVGETVRFLVRAQPDADPTRTQYAGYVYLQSENRWQHMATFSTLAEGHQLRGFYSFVEDFLRNGESATVSRGASFRNGWVLPVGKDEAWIELDQARFTADRTPSDNINAVFQNGYFSLVTGGDTENANASLRDFIDGRQQSFSRPVGLPAMTP